jgi:glycosyltransferase involved in cell wall biosynthesis
LCWGIDQSDIYVQPSRYEGYCLTILEAKCLNKPIITTNVNGVKEQLINAQTALIVGINENEIYDAIKKLIDSSKLREELPQNLLKEICSDNLEIEKNL